MLLAGLFDKWRCRSGSTPSTEDPPTITAAEELLSCTVITTDASSSSVCRFLASKLDSPKRTHNLTAKHAHLPFHHGSSPPPGRTLPPPPHPAPPASIGAPASGPSRR